MPGLKSGMDGKGLKRMVRGGLLGLAALAISLVFHWAGWLSAIENKTWDFRASVLADAQKASPEIVMILLDQNSLDWAGKTLGLTWPWPREIYGILVDFCKRRGARGLAFDVIYSEPSPYGVADDRLFADALSRFGHVANAAVLGNSSGTQTHWPGTIPRPGFRVENLKSRSGQIQNYGPTFSRITLPIPEIAENSRILCNVNLAPDTDGIYRKIPVFSLFDKHAVPGMGLGLFLSAHPGTQGIMTSEGLRLNDYTIPLDRQGRTILRYRGPSGTHTIVSAAWVLQSEISFRSGKEQGNGERTSFKDKYVFFGFSAPGLFDIHASPIDSQCPGVEIHATFLDNLLSRDFIKAVPFPLVLASAFSLAVSCGMLSAFYIRVRPLVAIGIGYVMVPLVCGLLAYGMGFWLPVAILESSIVLTISFVWVINYAVEGRQRRFIKTAFHHYLSPEVIDQIIQNPDRLRLGGERRILSIFFSDLEGFTSLSESMEPEALTEFLNQYLTAMTDIIHQEGGTIDKYEGDAIIAFWNAPLETCDHAIKCVRAALGCQEKLTRMQPYFREQVGRDIFMRIGMNTGLAVVGNLGSDTRFDYTMIGDAVNLAARLESANKQFGTHTMVSEATHALVASEFSFRELGKIGVKGRRQAVRVYEPMFPEVYEANLQVYASFARGLALYYEGRFEAAEALFLSLADKDPAAGAYVAICQTYGAAPPLDWDGCWVMTQK
ncbi:MAG: adenylate/guanylate cyclase domain-containing protein [Proteobacteria bacterium]|nr:adenylate/guanylate cyclase domain-containing protein [Pseudomonadota bacterium]